MLNLKNSRNGYAWGYLDKSEGILFANMAILVDFVEKEKAFDCHVDWRSAAECNANGENENDPSSDANRDAHAAAKKEILEIYNWWVKGRKEEHDALDKMSDDAYQHTSFKLEPSKDHPKMFDMVTANRPSSDVVEDLWNRESALEEKDKEMMIRLIKVSGFMWT
jgi:hypothetical protein